MPARELQEQLVTLREQLEQTPPLNEQERGDLHELMTQIEAKIELDAATGGDNDLSTGVQLAVDRFEVSHPSLAASLRSIMQTLGSIGI